MKKVAISKIYFELKRMKYIRELFACTQGSKTMKNRPIRHKNRGIFQKIRGFFGSRTVRKGGVSANLQKLIGFGVSKKNKPGIHFLRLQISTGNPLFHGGKSGRFCLSPAVHLYGSSYSRHQLN